MAIFRKTKEPTGPAVVAAAMPVSGPGVSKANRMRNVKTNADWQREGWYFFDVIGEFRGPLVWIANAISQADIHATELDRETGKPTGPASDPRAISAAAQVLGGAAQRAGLLRRLALCWQVPGEAWVIVKPTPPRRGVRQPDEWIVLPPSKISAKGTGASAQWQYADPKTGIDVVLESNALLFRVWQPHPAEPLQADSAARPALPVCREIEKSSQNIAARLDSRLSTAGFLLVANEAGIPIGDHDTTADALADEILTVAEIGIQQPGTAAAVVPITINAPGELISSDGVLRFVDGATEFVASVVDLRNDALQRLAATLDMPKDVAAGTQGESNHWSAWQVEESTYKIYIEPLLKELGDAITEQWFRPALVAMGMTPEDAEGFEIGWDTTAIVARPDDTENLRDLHDRILISNQYMLAENGVPEDARPNDAEYTQRLLERIVIGAPTLLSDPNVAQALGLDITVAPAATGVSGEIEGGELEATTPAPSEPRALPASEEAEPEAEEVPDGLVAAAEVIVRQALDRAGGRLLTRENRGQFPTVPKEALYQHVRPSDPTSLVDVRYAECVAEEFGRNGDQLRKALRRHVFQLLSTGRAYNRDELRKALR